MPAVTALPSFVRSPHCRKRRRGGGPREGGREKGREGGREGVSGRRRAQ
jgi:hypothetical protein